MKMTVNLILIHKRICTMQRQNNEQTGDEINIHWTADEHVKELNYAMEYFLF